MAVKQGRKDPTRAVIIDHSASKGAEAVAQSITSPKERPGSGRGASWIMRWRCAPTGFGPIQSSAMLSRGVTGKMKLSSCGNSGDLFRGKASCTPPTMVSGGIGTNHTTTVNIKEIESYIWKTEKRD